MAKITGPLLSLAATGSVAGTLTFGTWKGRPTVRQLVTPSNPQTAGQTSNRAMMRFLGQAWAPGIITDDTLPSMWQELADQGKYSPFNAFVANNMNRWTQFVPPHFGPNDASAAAVATYTAWTATTGVRQVTLNWQITLASMWGAVIFRALGAAPTGLKTEAIAVVAGATTVAGSYIDTPLEPGTYHYKIWPFSFGGAFSTLKSADVNADAT